MPTLTLVRVLFCGQGMMALVEVYDDGVEKAKADYLALIDCGGSQKYSVDAINAIVTKVGARTPPRLDYLVISHQDRDHVARLADLGPRLKKIKATVGTIFLGGVEWSDKNKTTVNLFIKTVGYKGDAVKFAGVKESSYTGATQRAEVTCLAEHEDVYLRLLVSRIPLPNEEEDIRRNASSAVVAIENGTYSVVLPGDATVQTMTEINGSPAVTLKLLPEVVGLEVPHHGALRTSVTNYAAGGDPDTFTYTVATNFSAAMPAKRIVASAGPRNRHKHPMQEILTRFATGLADVDEHSYVAWVFASERWTNNPTKKGTYATVRQLDGLDPKKSGAAKRRKTTTLETGEVVLKLAPLGVLRPEEMVEFRPYRRAGASDTEEPPVYAPAP